MISNKTLERYEQLKERAYPEAYNILKNKKILTELKEYKLPTLTDDEIKEIREHTEKIEEKTQILEQYKKLTDNIDILTGIYEENTTIGQKIKIIKEYKTQFQTLNTQIQQEKNLKEPTYKLKKTAEILNTQIRILIGKYKYIQTEKDKPTKNEAPEI